jgi:hypothetical protein
VRWWRNLLGGNDVSVTLRGRKVTGRPTVLADGSAQLQTALHDLLIASPRDAAHAGVAFDADGRPAASDIARASESLVFISIELRD